MEPPFGNAPKSTHYQCVALLLSYGGEWSDRGDSNPRLKAWKARGLAAFRLSHGGVGWT